MTDVSHELRFCGGGKWPRNQRNYVRSIVNPACELALAGYDELIGGLDIQPTVSIYKDRRVQEALGETNNFTGFELNFRAVDVKRKKLESGKRGNSFSRIMSVAFHETVHVGRLANISDNDGLECIASEGLSYVFTELFLSMLGEDPYEKAIPTPGSADYYYEDMLRQSTFDALSKITEVEDLYELIYGEGQHAAILVGCFSVCRALERGVEPKELLSIPANVILDV